MSTPDRPISIITGIKLPAALVGPDKPPSAENPFPNQDGSDFPIIPPIPPIFRLPLIHPISLTSPSSPLRRLNSLREASEASKFQVPNKDRGRYRISGRSRRGSSGYHGRGRSSRERCPRCGEKGEKSFAGIGPTANHNCDAGGGQSRVSRIQPQMPYMHRRNLTSK